METSIEPQQKEVIYKMGYNFALEGLDWENYKTFYSTSQEKLYNLEHDIFMRGFQEGQELLENTYNNDKVEVTKSR